MHAGKSLPNIQITGATKCIFLHGAEGLVLEGSYRIIICQQPPDLQCPGRGVGGGGAQWEK